tara:strand:+ start:2471 stop:2683 length:213 start_codon:yes stop_codon:yes gene_type:complete
MSVVDENHQLLETSRNVLRHHINELNVTYESAKLDWNSTSRTEIAINLSKLIYPYFVLEDFLSTEYGEDE